MAFLHSGHNSKIKLSAYEMLEISREISRNFTPCFLSPMPDSAEKIRLTPSELLDIGEEIGRDFAPKQSCNVPELMLLPVDPGHLYAYWNLGESAKSDNDQLTLRIYAQSDEESAASETASWFDVAIGNSKTQQQVALPQLTDHMAYSAVIGQYATDDGFTEFVRSNIIYAHGGQTAWRQDSVYYSNKTASGLGIGK